MIILVDKLLGQLSLFFRRGKRHSNSSSRILLSLQRLFHYLPLSLSNMILNGYFPSPIDYFPPLVFARYFLLEREGLNHY